VSIEEGGEDPRNINIPESEGHCKVAGPKAEVPDISHLLKTKEMNIGSKVQSKFANICDFWDEDTVDKVTNLLREYHDFFPTKFSYLKGIVGDLGTMKINLNPDVKPVKQCPYRLNHKYKDKVRDEWVRFLQLGLLSLSKYRNGLVLWWFSKIRRRVRFRYA